MPVMPSQSVLLVEADEMLRECLCEMLSDAGLQVAEAADAVEALQRMNRDGAPGVLVTGRTLGAGMSGPALIVAARLRWPELRAVLMNGDDTAKLTSLASHPGRPSPGRPLPSKQPSLDALIQDVTQASAHASRAPQST